MSEAPLTNTYRIALAQELLDDIELSRLPPESLLLKASRLARLVGDKSIGAWLNLELTGFLHDDPVSLQYMEVTGRWADHERKQGYWQSLPEIEAHIWACRLRLEQARTPAINLASVTQRPHELATGWGAEQIPQMTTALTQTLENQQMLYQAITMFNAVRARVLAHLHTFVSAVFNQLAFSNEQQGLFEAYRTLVDGELGSVVRDALGTLPAMPEGPAGEEPASIVAAVAAARAMLEAFADVMLPGTDQTLEVDGVQLKLTAKHHHNRLRAIVHLRCTQSLRRQRLLHAVDDLWARVASAPKSKEVSAEEARLLLLHVYLLTGEMLTLPEPPPAEPAPAPAAG